MKTNMRKADVKKQIVALALAAVFALPGAVLAADTKFPLTPNSGAMEFDHLKRQYEIPNFRIGGRYVLCHQSSNGAEVSIIKAPQIQNKAPNEL